MSTGKQNTFIVPADHDGKRLDQVLALLAGISRSAAAALVGSGVLVDAKLQPAKYKVSTGQKLVIPQLPDTRTVLEPIAEPEIVYQDNTILVVNKPAGVIVHPARHFAEPSLAGYAKTVSDDPDSLRPGIVHRLDRQTSGLIIIAKTESAKTALQAQFSEREVHKTYVALVHGHLSEDSAVLDWPIGRHTARPTMRMVRADGKPSRTKYQVIEQFSGYTLVQVMPETGRTHQIRVHMAHLGHPVVGDGQYGPGRPTLGLARLFLHAARLQFKSPSGSPVDVSCPLPQDLEDTLDRLRSEHV